MITPEADPAVIDLFRNHPKVLENPDLLEPWVNRYYDHDGTKPIPKGCTPPEFMIHQKRWSVFRKVGYDADTKKFGKVVCTPNGGIPYPGYPNPENSRDFASYEDVKKLCDLDTSFVPAFYILKTDRLIFLDFDQPCEKPNYPTYTEKSISGGFHVFGWYDGPKPVLTDTKEVYQDRRWVIVTGDIVDGKRDINDISDLIADLAPQPVQKYRTFTPSQKVPDKIPSGSRNNTIFQLAASLRAKGLSEQSILAALMIENQNRCTPPLPDDEVRAIAQSAGRYPAGAMQERHVDRTTTQSADEIKARLENMGCLI